MSPVPNLTVPTRVVVASFADAVTLRRPTDDTDTDGNPLPDDAAPVLATTTGTLTVRSATGRPGFDVIGDDTAATCSLAIDEDVQAGDLIDARGATWRVTAVELLRTRQRARLEKP